MQAYLRVTAGPDAGRNFDLTEGLTLTIGRGEKSDTKLTDAFGLAAALPVKWEDGKFLLLRPRQRRRHVGRRPEGRRNTS